MSDFKPEHEDWLFSKPTSSPAVTDILIEVLSAALTQARKALEPFAALRADDGDTFNAYPRETIIRCEVTVGEILDARAATEQDATKPRIPTSGGEK